MAMSAINTSIRFMVFPLESIRAGLAGADAHDLLEVEDEDLAVADFARVGGLLDRLDHSIEQIALDGRFDLDLRQEIDDVLGAPIQLGMSFLTPESLDLRDSDPLHADRGERLSNLVQLERLDDGGNQSHFSPLVIKRINPVFRAKIRTSSVQT